MFQMRSKKFYLNILKFSFSMRSLLLKKNMKISLSSYKYWVLIVFDGSKSLHVQVSFSYSCSRFLLKFWHLWVSRLTCFLPKSVKPLLNNVNFQNLLIRWLSHISSTNMLNFFKVWVSISYFIIVKVDNL